MIPLYNIHLHELFRVPIKKTLKKHRAQSLEKRLHAELDKLCHGPRINTHTSLKNISNPKLQDLVWRAWVGRHRLVFLAYIQKQRIFPLYLSHDPRNGYDYENLAHIEELAAEITDDFEAECCDKFARWPCK